MIKNLKYSRASSEVNTLTTNVETFVSNQQSMNKFIETYNNTINSTLGNKSHFKIPNKKLNRKLKKSVNESTSNRASATTIASSVKVDSEKLDNNENYKTIYTNHDRFKSNSKEPNKKDFNSFQNFRACIPKSNYDDVESEDQKHHKSITGAFILDAFKARVISKIKKNYKEQLEESKNLTEHIIKIKDNITLVNAQNEDIKKTSNSIRASNTHLRAVSAQYKIRNQSMKKDYDKLKKDIEKLRKEIAKNEKEKVELETQVLPIKAEIDEIKEYSKRKQQKIDETKDLIKMIKSSILVIHKRMEEIKFDMDSITHKKTEEKNKVQLFLENYKSYDEL